MTNDAARVTGGAVASLKSRIVLASAWVVVGSLAGNVIRLLSNLVLTRLLFPEAFGLMMIATTVLVVTGMLSDVGIRQSIVRDARGEDPVFLDTAWSMQIIRGGVMWLGACCIALGLHLAVSLGWIASHSTYANPLLPWVIVATSFAAVINGFQATDVAGANRRLNMKPILFLEMATQLFGVALMVILAWLMKSVWALVISGLATTTLFSLLSHRVFGVHTNRWRIDPQAMRELVAFGKWVALSSAVSVFVSNGDRLILGALVGPQLLGLFSIAVNLAGALDQILQGLFARVMLPVFGEVARNQPARIAEAFIRLRWRIDPVMLGAGGALFALGPLIISTLYDARYHDAGQMLQILSLGLVVSRFFMVQQVYLALNEPRYLAPLNLVRLLPLCVGVPLAFQQYGLNGALAVIALKDIAALPVIFWFNSRHGLNSFRLELVWLLFWPAGWCLGWAIVALHAWLAVSS